MIRQPLFPMENAQEPLTWADLLDEVTAPQDVLRVAKDFLATWDPYELAALPPECKPPAYFLEDFSRILDIVDDQGADVEQFGDGQPLNELA